jgi:hypothetical protein
MWETAAVFSCAGVGLTLLSAAYARWIVTHVWETPGEENTFGSVIRRLGDPLEVLDAAAGQVWYQLAASALLFGFGVVWLVASARGAQASTRRRDARLVLGATATLMGVSIVFMSDRVRADYVIYGRYNDAIVWPIVGVGLCWVLAAGWGATVRFRAWVTAAMAVIALELALLVNQLHHTQLRDLEQGQMVAGVLPVIAALRSANPIPITFVSFAVCAALFGSTLLRRAPRFATLGLVATAVLVAGGAVVHNDRAKLNFLEPARAVIQAEGLLPPGEPVGFAFQPRVVGDPSGIPLYIQLQYALAYQWYLPGVEFRTYAGQRDSVGSSVFAVTYHDDLIEGGAELIWADQDLWVGLWRTQVDVATAARRG